MPETERQRTERLLGEQLARIRQAETAQDRPHGAPPRGVPGRYAALSMARLFSKPRSIRRIEEAVAKLYQSLPRWRTAKQKSNRLAGDGTEALRGEQALDALYAAAAADPPREAAGRRRFERPAPSLDGRIAPAKHDLPNVSGGSRKLAGMKEAPARDWGPPPKVQFPRPDRKKDRRSDLVVAALGVALGLTCALFPWYIFFNQEQFGVQAIAFGGRGDNAGRIVVDPKPGTALAQAVAQQMPKNLDLFSTGTVQPKPETPKAPGVDQQPFPAEAEFRLVHVANGRAMIEDDAGLWIVQQGSNLPDSTRVKSIEKREGRWVLVTSADRVIEISQ